MKRLILACVAPLCLMMAMPAAAQFQKPEQAVKYRKSVFTVTSQHMSRLRAMAEGKAPFDPKLAEANANLVAMLAPLPWSAFGEGTNVGNTDAKPEVWSQGDKFKQASQAYQDEVVKLQAAAKTGNLDQLKAALGATGKSCKACHDSFKKD
ncbi:c-type cytochrome [Ideonella livida]|uniref:Cytochrome c n=1 Tax=Ideonella livida TaxID=2707176 RepID=A0A7C9TKX3_9BURK|nr:cytochrome c [Ideonella livida]NDY92182.1 cytochrome c [Ideonella livida]